MQENRKTKYNAARLSRRMDGETLVAETGFENLKTVGEHFKVDF